jgi:hypothetical protein
VRLSSALSEKLSVLFLRKMGGDSFESKAGEKLVLVKVRWVVTAPADRGRRG